jgi:hypothetical protein
MASTEDKDTGMGEEVVAKADAARPSVKRLHSSHDSGMESELDGSLVGTNLRNFVCVSNNARRILYEVTHALTHCIALARSSQIPFSVTRTSILQSARVIKRSISFRMFLELSRMDVSRYS